MRIKLVHKKFAFRPVDAIQFNFIRYIAGF